MPEVYSSEYEEIRIAGQYWEFAAGTVTEVPADLLDEILLASPYLMLVRQADPNEGDAVIGNLPVADDLPDPEEIDWGEPEPTLYYERLSEAKHVALMDAGYMSNADIESAPDEDLLNVPGIGPAALDILRHRR